MSLVFRRFKIVIKTIAIVNGVLVLPIYGFFGPSLLTVFGAVLAGINCYALVCFVHFDPTVLPVVQVNPFYLSNLA